MTGILRVVCAWCKTVLEEGDEGELTSHGCCNPPCPEMIEAGVA